MKYYLNERRYEDYQQIFLKYAKRGEITSNIWVYIGSFQKENTIRKECVHYTSDPSSIDFNWYCNILSSHIYEQVEPGSIELFEQNHIIIKFFDYRRSSYLSQRLSMFYYEQILAGLSEEEILEQLMNSSNNEFEIEEIIIPGKKKYQKERKVDNNE